MTPERTWSRSYYNFKAFRLAAWLRYLSIPVFLLTAIASKKHAGDVLLAFQWKHEADKWRQKNTDECACPPPLPLFAPKNLKLSRLFFISPQHQLCKWPPAWLWKSVCDPGRSFQPAVAVPLNQWWWWWGGGTFSNNDCKYFIPLLKCYILYYLSNKLEKNTEGKSASMCRFSCC